MSDEIKIQCEECKKTFEHGNDKDGIPNGFGFQMQDGHIYNICRECLKRIGNQRMWDIYE